MNSEIFLSEQHKELLDTLPFAVVKCEIVFDQDNQIQDFIIKEANEYFKEITNIENEFLIERKCKEVLPELENSLFDWVTIFCEAALTAENKVIEQYFEIFDKYLRVQVFGIDKNQFNIYIFNQTEKKHIKKIILEKDSKIEYLQAEVSRKGIIDNLTGTYDHQYIVNSIRDDIDCFNENDSDFTAVILDIDDFEVINNKYGRKEGDRILKEVAEAISNRIRKIDVVGRYGCDEFIIVLSNVDIDIAKIIVERIKNDINKFVKGFPDLRITVSGAALEYNGQTLEEYLKNIENKLKKAKSFGKNTVMI